MVKVSKKSWADIKKRSALQVKWKKIYFLIQVSERLLLFAISVHNGFHYSRVLSFSVWNSFFISFFNHKISILSLTGLRMWVLQHHINYWFRIYMHIYITYCTIRLCFSLGCSLCSGLTKIWSVWCCRDVPLCLSQNSYILCWEYDAFWHGTAVQLTFLAMHKQQWQLAFPYTAVRTAVVSRAVLMHICWGGYEAGREIFITEWYHRMTVC